MTERACGVTVEEPVFRDMLRAVDSAICYLESVERSDDQERSLRRYRLTYDEARDALDRHG